MSDAPAAPPVAIETTGSAIIARVNLKLFDDKNLKLMEQMIDEAATKPGVTTVVLDMSRVQIVPSLGLGALVQLNKKCRARQQRLKLAGVVPMVRQTMSITKLDRILDLEDSVDAALA